MRRMAVRLLAVLLVLLLGAHHPLMGGMPAMAASGGPGAATIMPANEHAAMPAACACQVAGADTACLLMIAAPPRAAPISVSLASAAGRPAAMGMCPPRTAPARGAPPSRAASASRRQALLGILRR